MDVVEQVLLTYAFGASHSKFCLYSARPTTHTLTLADTLVNGLALALQKLCVDSLSNFGFQVMDE